MAGAQPKGFHAELHWVAALLQVVARHSGRVGTRGVPSRRQNSSEKGQQDAEAGSSVPQRRPVGQAGRTRPRGRSGRRPAEEVFQRRTRRKAGREVGSCKASGDREIQTTGGSGEGDVQRGSRLGRVRGDISREGGAECDGFAVSSDEWDRPAHGPRDGQARKTSVQAAVAKESLATGKKALKEDVGNESVSEARAGAEAGDTSTAEDSIGREKTRNSQRGRTMPKWSRT